MADAATAAPAAAAEGATALPLQNDVDAVAALEALAFALRADKLFFRSDDRNVAYLLRRLRHASRHTKRLARSVAASDLMVAPHGARGLCGVHSRLLACVAEACADGTLLGPAHKPRRPRQRSAGGACSAAFGGAAIAAAAAIVPKVSFVALEAGDVLGGDSADGLDDHDADADDVVPDSDPE
jgi:hypothetical protein